MRSIAVIGGGPAGMAAAVHAGEAGASVILVDAGDQLGGQFWRHREESLGSTGAVADYLGLRTRLLRLIGTGTVDHRPDTAVTAISDRGDRGLLLRCSSPRSPQARPPVVADRLVLATGAHDRQLPIPGWDLPGVYTAGGIQALLKGTGTLPGKRLLVAGTGVFLLPVATQAAAAGVRVVGICDANSPSAWIRQGTRPFLPSKIIEGAGYALGLLHHRIAFRPRRVIVEILGRDRVQAVITAQLDREGVPDRRTATRTQVDVVGLGWGFTPQLELAVSLGVDLRTDTDGSLVVRVGADQSTSDRRVWAAGESTGIGGARLAVAEGRVAGRAAAGAAPGPVADVRRHRRFADALHATAPIPPRWQEWLRPDTVVCRCEEVTVAELHHARDVLAATDGRSAKGLTRAGMGWCQGRICASAAAAIVGSAEESGQLASLRQQHNRPLAAPITVAELAGWDDRTAD